MTRVLIVEDSEPLGRLLAQTLERAGHDSCWAATGAAALVEAEKLTPEAVLVDLHLSDVAGADLVATLRGTLPTARIIGVSGEVPAAAVRAQFDVFLLKPVGLETLLSAVTGQ